MKRSSVIALIGIFALNLLLKVIYLGANSIAGDEPFTIYHAQMSVGGIIAQLTQGNNPPLYEIIMHFWLKIVGLDPFWMRFPSAVFSAITAVFIFLIGKKFASFQAGLIAALLYTFANLHLSLAHEVRVYSWFMMWTSIAMYLYLEFRQKPSSLLILVALMLSNTLLLYSHYFGFFVLLIQVICTLLLVENRKQILQRYCWVGLGVFVLFIPNLLILISRFSTSAQGGTWVEKPNGIETLYNMVWIFSNQPLNTILCLAVFIAGITVAIIQKRWRPKLGLSKIALIWFLFPFLFLFAISYKIPVYVDRYVAFCSLGYYLLIACILEQLIPKKGISWLVSGVLVLIFAFTFKPNLTNKREVKEMISVVKSLKKADNTLLICGHDFLFNFCFYYDQELFKDVNEQNVYENMEKALAKRGIYALYKFDDSLVLKDEVIYLDAAADFSNPGNRMYEGLIQQGYVEQQKTHVPAIFNVFVFSKKQD